MSLIRLRYSLKPGALILLLGGLVALALGLFLALSGWTSSNRNGRGELAPASDSEMTTLRKQARLLDGKVRKLTAMEGRLFPNGPAILVDTSENKITLIQGARVIVQGTCSTGNGMELTDDTGKRSWTFDTPRGSFRVLGKVSNPVWYRPDWSFIEEGEPVPKDRSSRAMPDVLGDYALAFGNGYFIHGTLYTRLLGSNVTHGCIRVDDALLKKIYDTARPGTPIWIY